MICSKRPASRIRQVLTALIVVAPSLALAWDHWSRYSEPPARVQTKPTPQDTKWIDSLGEVLKETPWVWECDVIARQVNAAQKRYREISETLKRGETDLARVELSDLQATLAKLALHNALADHVAILRERLARARKGLSAELLDRVEVGTDLVRLSQESEDAWKQGDFTTAKRLFSEAYEDVLRWLEVNATSDGVTAWRQAEGVTDLLAANKDLASQIRELTKQSLLDRDELAAKVKDLQATLVAAEANKKAALDHARDELADERKAGTKLKDELQEVRRGAQSKDQRLVAVEKALGLANAELADVRAGLASAAEKAQRASPSQLADDFYKHGKAWMKQEKYGSAIPNLAAAICLDPDCFDAYNNLGTAFMKLGVYGEAIKMHERAIDLRPADPEYPWAYTSLGWLLAQCPDERYRDVARAIRLGETADRLTGGKNPEVRRFLTTVYREARATTEVGWGWRRHAR